MVFIDALNLAYWCGDPPSLRLPITLMTQLLARGDRAMLYFDASAQQRLAAEAALYAALVQHTGFCVEVPHGIPADQEILKQASRQGGCVVSRDKYRDYRKKYRRLINDPARLFAGTIADDRLCIPALGLDAPLAASGTAAWNDLQPLLQSLTPSTGSHHVHPPD